MKTLFIILIIISVTKGFTQTKGISYQALILNPKEQKLPGLDAKRSILVNTKIVVRFSINDEIDELLYKELHSTQTDRFGMVSLLIGSGERIGSKRFNNISWDGKPKNLLVEIDFLKNSQFTLISKQELTYIPQPSNEKTELVLNHLIEEQTNIKEDISNIQLIPGPIGPQGSQGIPGVQGLQGIQGDTGIQGIQGDTGSQGLQGDAGQTGAKGEPGADGVSIDLTNIQSNVLPSLDNKYTLGDTDHRWAGIHVGPGTIYITDITLDTDAELTVDNGILEINGANQLQVGQLKFVDNKIESLTSKTDIQIGELTDDASLVLNRDIVIGLNKGLKFQDSTIQLTAPVNPDWDASSGLAQILNKPLLLQGDAGIQGLQGDAGVQGIQGDTGIQGLQGDAGTQGIQGDAGVQGIQGETGIQGIQGETGIQGIQGDAGVQGIQGDAGVQGLQGDTGIQGLQGDAGTQGIQGDAGIQGIQGDAGVQGLQGDTGIQGLQGDAGTQGIQGDTGVQGLQGDTGVQGLQGDTGIQGLQGDAGTQGIQGDAGIQGIQGDAGTQGIQGDAGVQGLQGDTGIQGLQGDPGPISTEVNYSSIFSVISGTEPVGESITSNYIKFGKLIFIVINVNFSSTSEFGINQYTLTLPFESKYDMIVTSGRLHTDSKNDNYGIHAELTAGSINAKLVYTGNGGRDEPFTSSNPKTLTTLDHFILSGSYMGQ
jgi:hypothetical protein